MTENEGNISEYKNEISMKLLWEIRYQLAICTTPRSTAKYSSIIYVFTKLHVSSLLDIFILQKRKSYFHYHEFDTWTVHRTILLTCVQQKSILWHGNMGGAMI